MMASRSAYVEPRTFPCPDCAQIAFVVSLAGLFALANYAIGMMAIYTDKALIPAVTRPIAQPLPAANP